MSYHILGVIRSGRSLTYRKTWVVWIQICKIVNANYDFISAQYVHMILAFLISWFLPQVLLVSGHLFQSKNSLSVSRYSCRRVGWLIKVFSINSKNYWFLRKLKKKKPIDVERQFLSVISICYLYIYKTKQTTVNVYITFYWLGSPYFAFYWNDQLQV